MLFPIMDILSGRERHQVIISGTMQQAKNRIATIARELRTNAHIRDTFFGGKVPRFKSTTRSIEIGNCRIEAFSARSEMHGISQEKIMAEFPNTCKTNSETNHPTNFPATTSKNEKRGGISEASEPKRNQRSRA